MGPRGGFRGGARGRGRGRGRGASRGGHMPKRQKFDTSRLADNEDSENESSQDQGDVLSDSAEDHDEAFSGDEGSDDEENKSSSKAYQNLMKSLAESSAPQAKRRKLDHSGRQAEIASNDEVEPTGNDPGRDVDLVEEPEEGPEEGVAEDGSDNEDEDASADMSDPFETHFDNPVETEVAVKLKAIQSDEFSTVKAPGTQSSRMVFTLPGKESGSSFQQPSPVLGPDGLKLKLKLKETIVSQRSKFDAVEQRVAPLLFEYFDTLFCERSVANGESLRRMSCLHALNHIFKTRDRVIKNNTKFAKEEGNDELELRDQGFTRPKVLMILPTRQSCVKMIDMITKLVGPTQQENRKRFEESYIDTESRFSDDRPADFRDLFEGNDDDMFRLGLKFTRKTIKYFAQFYNSDIIFGSPLGLRMAIGSVEDKKKIDYDFLSSIEMVIMDQADALLMQNWEHVEYIFEHMNKQPKEQHGCDFSRVRTWYLDDQTRYYRQTIAFSAFNTPELSELFRTHCHNWAGKVRVTPVYPGVLQQLGVRTKQTFSRFEVASAEDDPDARFAYFTKAILPALTKRPKESGGTLVFIPSYLDFVRVRNYLSTSHATSSLTFGTISEYADVPEASRARSHFVNGRHRVLLYTERAHHFRRYQLKGVRQVIMYGLPDNPLFYREITGANLIKSEQEGSIEPGRGTIRVMFSKYDVLKLERIVGTTRVGKMIRERGDTFVFEEERSR